MKEIKTYIESYFQLGGKNLEPIAQLFKEKTLKKGEFFLKENQKVNKISFVKSGYLRVHALSANGEKEITQWISNRGLFITDLSGFIFGTPSRWNIQALSDCELYTISKADYLSIGDLVKEWEKLDKLFIANCFVTLETRVFNLISMSSEQKVQNLMEYNAELFNQVPLHYIASMLGMTPETLSRIRRKMIS